MKSTNRTLIAVALLLGLGVAGIVAMYRGRDRSGDAGGDAAPVNGGKSEAAGMNPLAERYVRLVLALGQHDADYVDAYYGAPEWRKEEEAAKRSLPDIERDAADVAKALEAVMPPR